MAGVDQIEDEVVLVVAVECAGGLGGGSECNTNLRKLRICRRDLRHTESGEFTGGEGVSYTGRTLQGAILRQLQNTVEGNDDTSLESSLSVNHGWDDDGFNCERVVVEAYDDRKSEFVSLLHADVRDEDVAPRFGSRVRCIVSFDRASPLEDTNGTRTRDGGGDGGGGSLASEGKTALLAIMGRFFPYDAERGIQFAGRHLIVKEIPNNRSDGTGLNVWDGALLLARYLEAQPHKVRSKRVLELGSGCGLVGIAAGMLGAKEVVLTDLPYTLPLMRENVDHNRADIDTSGCERMECATCDWFEPPSMEKFGFTPPATIFVEQGEAQTHASYGCPDVLLVADCVWVDELVDPLLRTVQTLISQSSPGMDVLVTYQRRGRKAHEAFWSGLHVLFDTVTEIDTTAVGLSKPDVLYLLECRQG